MNYHQAEQRVQELRKFYKGIFWFAIISGFVFFDDIFEKGVFDFSLFDGSIILGIWAAILAVKAVKLFIFDSEWEKEVMEKEMKKSKDPINF